MIFNEENKTITLNDIIIPILHMKDDGIYIKANSFLQGLGYINPRKYYAVIEVNLRRYETEDAKFIIDFQSLKNKYKDEIAFQEHPKTLFINEDGIYEFLSNSEKTCAHEFRRWVRKVLRTIRRDGVYIRNQEKDKEIEKLQRAIANHMREKELLVEKAVCDVQPSRNTRFIVFIKDINRPREMHVKRVQNITAQKFLEIEINILYPNHRIIYNKEVACSIKLYNKIKNDCKLGNAAILQNYKNNNFKIRNGITSDELVDYINLCNDLVI